MNLGRRMIPDLAVLQAFECAARHRNFTQAAAELHLTQSAISRQIKTLEAQLGVLLFERVRKRVILSAAGRKLLPEIRRLLAQSEEIVLRARASADGTSVLSLATLPTLGNRWLMPRLADFLASHPHVAVNVASRSEPFDFTVEEFDIAIHYGQPFWPRATCTYLFSEKVVPVASPTLLQSADFDGPAAIPAGPLLHLATRPRQWAEWFELNGLDVEKAHRGNRFDQFSMIIEASVRGLGYALLPLYLIEDEIASRKLQVAASGSISTENGYYAVLPEGSQEGSLGQVFKTWLLGRIGTEAPAREPS